MKKLFLLAAAVCGSVQFSLACTGISLFAADSSYVQARTIEWAQSALESRYVIIPRGQSFTSLTADGKGGKVFTARYGVAGMSVVRPEFMAEGINEAGLSAGLFFFPGYGGYLPFDERHREHSLADLQVVQWMLCSFATVDEVMAGFGQVRVAGLVPESTVHWRIGDKSGRQVVLEIVNGTPRFYENTVGVLTNAPGFEWHLTNLKNYINLQPGDAQGMRMGGAALRPLGAGSGMLGLPGDATPPSRFVRAAFYRATAPQRATAFETVMQCFHLLDNFNVPIGSEHPIGKAPDIPSATQWTSAIDLTHGKIYYHTAYNRSIRCIDLGGIDFGRVAYQSHPLDTSPVQPVETVQIGQTDSGDK